MTFRVTSDRRGKDGRFADEDAQHAAVLSRPRGGGPDYKKVGPVDRRKAARRPDACQHPPEEVNSKDMTVMRTAIRLQVRAAEAWRGAGQQACFLARCRVHAAQFHMPVAADLLRQLASATAARDFLA